MNKIILMVAGAVLATLGLSAVPAQAATPAAAAKALSAAKTRLGMPYRYGAEGPGSFDCSGLTKWSYKQAGKTLPRTVQQQYGAVTHISLSSVKPGDLLFFGKDTRHLTHVGIFSGYRSGHGYMINANTGSYRGRQVVNAPTSEYKLGGLKEYGGRVK
jgi:cell wall-associated NlpC family hydrolase